MNFVPWGIMVILGFVIIIMRRSHKKEIIEVSNIFWEKGIVRGKTDKCVEDIQTTLQFILKSLLPKDALQRIEVSQTPEEILTSMQGKLNVRASRL